MKTVKKYSSTFVILFVMFLWGFAGTAIAHDPGLSTTTVTIGQEGLQAEMTFALQDAEAVTRLDEDLDAEVSRDEMVRGETTLVPVMAEALVIYLDGKPLTHTPPVIKIDDKNNVHVRWEFKGKAASEMSFQSTLLAALPKGHRQFLSVKDVAGGVLGEKMLSAQADSFVLSLAGKSNVAQHEGAAGMEEGQPSTFVDFLKLGVEHILTGYDHLLFLLALLVVTRDFWSSFKIVTCFTIAHSITLGLATFNVVQIPGAIVEPLIAATIVYVGLENLIRDEPKGRWLLTFIFGLVHGFGFASVLRELGVASGTTGIAVPLFSFNLGVELGQVTVAALVLPIIWRLRVRPAFARRWVPACSMLVVLAGGYWLLERTVLG
jgi:hydrogenase/urease accessory protein HupE